MATNIAWKRDEGPLPAVPAVRSSVVCAVLVAVAVVMLRDDDDGENASGCLSDLVAEVLGDESRIGDLISGDPAELLEREGPTLWLRAPLTGETYTWRTLRTSFDPAMLPLAGGND